MHTRTPLHTQRALASHQHAQEAAREITACSRPLDVDVVATAVAAAVAVTVTRDSENDTLRCPVALKCHQNTHKTNTSHAQHLTCVCVSVSAYRIGYVRTHGSVFQRVAIAPHLKAPALSTHAYSCMHDDALHARGCGAHITSHKQIYVGFVGYGAKDTERRQRVSVIVRWDMSFQSQNLYNKMPHNILIGRI